MRKLLLMLIVMLLVACGSNDDVEKEIDETEVEQEEQTEGSDTEDDTGVIEVNESVSSADYTVKIQRIKIDDDLLTVVFDWENQSDWNPAHFPLLGYIVVEQGGETLEQVGDTDRQNKQIKHGSFDVYDLEYKLIDNSDVTIQIVSTNEHDETRGKIKVSLE